MKDKKDKSLPTYVGPHGGVWQHIGTMNKEDQEKKGDEHAKALAELREEDGWVKIESGSFTLSEPAPLQGCSCTATSWADLLGSLQAGCPHIRNHVLFEELFSLFSRSDGKLPKLLGAGRPSRLLRLLGERAFLFFIILQPVTIQNRFRG